MNEWMNELEWHSVEHIMYLSQVQMPYLTTLAEAKLNLWDLLQNAAHFHQVTWRSGQ